jgi:hypothetical protein
MAGGHLKCSRISKEITGLESRKYQGALGMVSETCSVDGGGANKDSRHHGFYC